MPICTTCTSFTPYLYTVYQSAYNLRLEQCVRVLPYLPVYRSTNTQQSKCHSFADPYVEHDSLTLLLDLILLKRGVYRHLLYNRGTEPRRPTVGSKDDLTPSEVDLGVSLRNRERKRWLHVLRLGGALMVLDAFIRWSHLNPDQPTNLSPWTEETMNGVLRVFIGCCVETIAFHCGVIIACYIMLHLISWVQTWRYRGRMPPNSDIKREFRFSLIPLTLFYSSLTKLFLLFLLSIWRPTPTPADPSDSWGGKFLYDNFIINAFKVSDDDEVDREWVIRNVLGGMSAGFGLRVVLDINPIFTSIIILAGWRVKTGVASVVSGWVGGDEMTGEAWRAYSIP
ncbi:Arv1-like family-domain-containing protein [Lyophyllum atratum]|nr:Arv1-like family-domain-containing protein [Lyophyllum atratum]